MFEKLADLGFDSNEKAQVLENFIRLFCDYNKKVNLVSKKEINVLFEKHIYDSLAFNLFYQKYCNASIKLIDIGTGGGFPSLPIAMFFNSVDVTAVDSTLKKIKFIEFASKEIGLTNIHPLCKRAEELAFNAEFDVGVSRAMAQMRIILEYIIPYIKVGGYFVAYKSIKAEEEIQNAQNALKVLNSEIIDKIEYSLPIKEENKRVLIVVRKNKLTNNMYPRKNGLIVKKPL